MSHGGSCIFVRDGIKCIENTDILSLSIERYCEISSVKLLDDDINVICIYRTNLISDNEFLDIFEYLLDRIDAIAMQCLLVGDFNINILTGLSNTVKRLADLLSAHNMTNLVNFPTRVSATSSTCLDHVYTNLLQSDVSVSPVITHLSDHFAIRTKLMCRVLPSQQSHRYTRTLSHINKLNFSASLASIDWDRVITPYRSPEEMSMAIINILINKIDICFPMRKTRNSIIDSSWLTSDVRDYKILLFDIIEFNKCNSNDMVNTIICDMKVYYDKLINKRKTEYYSNLINYSKNTSKAMWNVINKERGKNSFSSQFNLADVIKSRDGSKFVSQKSAADAMNIWFLKAAVACNAPKADVSVVYRKLCMSVLPGDRSLRLAAFNPNEVYKIITKLIPPKPSQDVYGISMKLLKLAAAPLAPVLSQFFNICLRIGTYPTPMKLTKVSPLFKGKGKQDSMDSYRPVSIIPSIAKVFENGLSARLMSYMTAANFLSDQQYAYREGRSTISLLRELVRKVLVARENKQQAALICCDLSKAFDVADRGVLAAKLRHYGINGTAHKILVELMEERSQIVVSCGGAVRSDALRSEMGVAQGSSVSNILFSLLLNDLPGAVADADILMYADDVAALVVASSVEQLEQKLNDTAEELYEWFRANGLVLNLTKTYLIHFELSGRSTKALTVGMNNEQLTQVESISFLGIELDRCLKWENHINRVCGRLGSACFALGRIARIVSEREVRACYFATVHSLLQYGAELWGQAADRERIFRMQKRAIRAMVGIPSDATVRPYFIKLGVLTFPSMVIYQVALYVRVNLVSFPKPSTTHSYYTRHRENLSAISRTLTKSERTTHVMGPTVYNKLPRQVTSAPSLNSFKVRLKQWLVRQAFYTYDEFIKM